MNLDGPVYPPPVIDGDTCKTGNPGPKDDPAGLPDGTQFQSNGDIMIAGVVYNRDAFDWIRGQSLYKAETLDAQLKAGKASIAPFPAKAIVLRWKSRACCRLRSTRISNWQRDIRSKRVVATVIRALRGPAGSRR